MPYLLILIQIFHSQSILFYYVQSSKVNYSTNITSYNHVNLRKISKIYIPIAVTIIGKI